MAFGSETCNAVPCRKAARPRHRTRNGPSRWDAPSRTASATGVFPCRGRRFGPCSCADDRSGEGLLRGPDDATGSSGWVRKPVAPRQARSQGPSRNDFHAGIRRLGVEKQGSMVARPEDVPACRASFAAAVTEISGSWPIVASDNAHAFLAVRPAYGMPSNCIAFGRARPYPKYIMRLTGSWVEEAPCHSDRRRPPGGGADLCPPGQPHATDSIETALRRRIEEMMGAAPELETATSEGRKA